MARPAKPKSSEGPLTHARIMGEFLRRERKARRWTQQELAKRSGVGQSSISVFETADREVASADLSLLLSAFEIDLGELFIELAKLTRQLEKEPKAAEGKVAELPPAPPTHVRTASGYKKKRATAEVSADPPTSHRQG